MIETKSVYEKLNMCRVALQSVQMKKSGNNKFAGYSYFELGDFLPTVNQLFHQHGLCGIVSFSQQYAELVIVNVHLPDQKIVFSSPMADAMLKGCHPIQNLGAVQTYQRRYLYMMALEIVEHDALDSSEPIRGKNEGKGIIKPSDGVMEQFREDEQKFLKELAQTVQEAYTNDVGEAIKLLDEKHLEAEEKIAVWSLLDSKCRSAIKKAKAESQLVTQP